ncbi:MAG: carbon monoxide dehydrogenase, partial [Pseudomonadota bacterium]
MAHLRENGFRLGVAETGTGLAALSHVNACDPSDALLALKAVCAGSAEDVARFDDLFDSYWRNRGRVRQRITPKATSESKRHTRSTVPMKAPPSHNTGTPDQPDGGRGPGQSDTDGTGKLVASSIKNLMHKDLRDLVSTREIAEATEVARRLSIAMRDKRSRRRKSAVHGDRIDLRRVIRKSLGTGGEPLALPRK